MKIARAMPYLAIAVALGVTGIASARKSRKTEIYQGKRGVAREAVISFKGSEKEQAALASRIKGTIQGLGPYRRVRSRTLSTPRLIRILKKDPNVETAEPNYILTFL